MAKNARYRVPYRRRREQKTDYQARRILATSDNPRIVVRASNQDIIAPIVKAALDGDKARMDETGHLYITGRIKEIIVLGNGEKVPPADMEMAIALDPLFDQVMVIGEGRPGRH